MGYDMYIDGISDEDTLKATTLRKEASALYEQRNDLPEDQQPERLPRSIDWKEGTGSDEWWRLHREAEAKSEEAGKLEGYFRLNIWGMGKCRTTMHALGMLDVESHSPDFPETKTFDLDDWPDDEKEWPAESAEAKFLAAWNAARDSFIEGGLMPAYKMGSNDGWLIAPEEIENSLLMVEEFRKEREGKAAVLYVFVDPHTPPWFGEWLEFLARAKDQGGFRVY